MEKECGRISLWTASTAWLYFRVSQKSFRPLVRPIFKQLFGLFFLGTIILTMVAPRSGFAAEDMAALTAAMTEHLVCYPIELLGHEKQQLSVTDKDLCLAAAYRRTGLRPLWVTPKGPGPDASVILSFLVQAETEGLDPGNYEIDQISSLFAERDPRRLARLDTLLTFNLIKYIHDVSWGRIKSLDAGILPNSGSCDGDIETATKMEQILSVPDLGAYLAALPPSHRYYRQLKTALKTYRALEAAGGWPAIPPGPTIRPGDYDDRMPDIFRRLSVTGDLDTGFQPTMYYEPALKSAILRFQRRHGLTPDGVIGKNTFAALNISVSDAVKQIIINMTRWRWQAHTLGEKYVLVNIANFDLTAVDDGVEVLSFPVIVGKFQHQTPIFSDRIRYVDINPYWNVPPSIAKNEELPKLRRDPNHLKKQHIRLFSGWSAEAHEIDSRTVDWRNMSPQRMAGFRLRQDPGPWNALGRIKFVFPNPYDVYLHDTPTQNLFTRTQRDFSHGCIRVSDPMGLAAFLLTSETSVLTREAVRRIVEKRKRTVIRLPEPVPVHITYQTSWVDKNGIIYFNKDIYGRDDKLRRAMFAE